MAQRTTFAKLQRERARKARKHEKLAKRQSGPDAPAGDVEAVEDTPVSRVSERRGPIGPNELLRLTQQLTAAYESGELSEEEFEAQKKELMARL